MTENIKDTDSFSDKVANYKLIALEDRNKADEFYIDELLPEIAKIATLRRNEKELIPPEYDLLISMQGMSVGPSVIACACLKPRSVCLLYSTETKPKMDRMYTILSTLLNLKPTEIYRRVCLPTSASDIYTVIKSILLEYRKALNISTDEDIRVAIDVTGGKKVMSASGALTAWRENIDICYVDSKPSSEIIGRPEPGSEHLIMLGNPLNIFKEQEMSEAVAVFNRGYFTDAVVRFGMLEKALWKPAVARILLKLALLYDAWINFDYTQMSNLMNWFTINEEGFADYAPYLNMDAMKSVKERIVYINHFIAEQDNHLLKLLTCYCIACYYMRMARYEFAALMYYRVIEGCLTQRLLSKYKTKGTVNPDYTFIRYIEPKIDEKYRTIMRDMLIVKKREYIEYGQLPPWLGFVSSAAILLALDDEYIDEAGYTGTEGLVELERVSSIRNNSIIAHGYDRLSEKSVRVVKTTAFNFIT